MEQRREEERREEERKAMQDKQLKRYRKIRDTIHEYLHQPVNRLAIELKNNGYRNKGKVDLYLKLVGQQLADAKKWDNKIEEIASPDRVSGDVGKSRDLYLDCINKIADAAAELDDKDLAVLPLQWLVSQMPVSDCRSKNDSVDSDFFTVEALKDLKF